MFKDLLYFNANKVAEYKAVLEGKKHVAIKNVKISSSKSLEAKISVLSGGIGGSNEMEGELIDNLLLDSNEFEQLLEKSGGDHFFDFTVGNFDIETITKTSIIKFEGTLKIPHEFDMMDLITQFKPMLISSMQLANPQEEEIFKSIFAKESTKIPLLIESEVLDKNLGFAKLLSTELISNFETLEDYEYEDLTFIAKINSKKKYNNKPIVVFDIMKDLFSISRGLRRQMGSNEVEGMENIEVESDVIELEILAIYR